MTDLESSEDKENLLLGQNSESNILMRRVHRKEDKEIYYRFTIQNTVNKTWMCIKNATLQKTQLGLV